MLVFMHFTAKSAKIKPRGFVESSAYSAISAVKAFVPKVKGVYATASTKRQMFHPSPAVSATR
jgi:hypothetical protein